MDTNMTKKLMRSLLFITFSLFSSFLLAALPEAPNPPHLVNDFGSFMSPGEVQQLEQIGLFLVVLQKLLLEMVF